MKGHDRRCPVSLRLSVTRRCQLHCLYCRPTSGSCGTENEKTLGSDEILRFVRSMKSAFRLTKVHITGGEPLLRSDVVDLISMLSEEGIPDLALTTNGQMLSQVADALVRAGLKRINVSLDSIHPDTYSTLTHGGDVTRTMEGIRAARSCGLSPVKINSVILRGHNDDQVVDLAHFAFDTGCSIRFLELMPIGIASSIFEERFVSSSEVHGRLQDCFFLEPLPYEQSSSSRNYLAHDGTGRSTVIGFVSPHSKPFCETCTRVRLTSTGKLIPCLALEREIDIGTMLRSATESAQRKLVDIVAREIRNKTSREAFETLRPMAAVGG